VATIIFDLNIENLPADIQVRRAYAKALLLLRFNGKPVGKVTLPVEEGVVRISHHAETVFHAVSPVLWLKKIHDFVRLEPGFFQNHTLPSATIAITTRDRPEDLKRCLDALMKMPDQGQEIIVIDNCPATTASFDLVADYPKVRYVRENFPGSSAARNRALYESSREIVAFTDDDAVPDVNWLPALLRNFCDPRVMCVTGQVMPLELENDAQEWFEKFSPLGRGFQRIVYDGASTYNRFRVAPIGVSANMALRKSLIEKVGAFDEVLGVGTPTRCGEDHELFSRILARGYKIVYDPEALSWHKHRRTWLETKKTLFGYGVGVYSFWIRTLVKEREFSAMLLPWRWFYHSQLPNLWRAIRKRRGSIPIDFVLAELRGCLVGTRAYFLSRNQYNRKKVNSPSHGRQRNHTNTQPV